MPAFFFVATQAMAVEGSVFVKPLSTFRSYHGHTLLDKLIKDDINYHKNAFQN